jgi:hypothetical protein
MSLAFKVKESVKAAFLSSISFISFFFPSNLPFLSVPICFTFSSLSFHLCPIFPYFVLYFSLFFLYSSLMCSVFILAFFRFLLHPFWFPFFCTCLLFPSYTPSFCFVPPISGTVLNSLQLQTPDVSGIEYYTLLPKIPRRRLVSFVARKGY